MLHARTTFWVFNPVSYSINKNETIPRHIVIIHSFLWQTSISGPIPPESDNDKKIINDKRQVKIWMKRETSKNRFKTIDGYIAEFPKSVRDILEEFRMIIRETAPEAEEAIRYGIPTFRFNGNLVHFAAFKNHIGFYPTPSAIFTFEKELSGYTLAKGTVQFLIDKPIPFDLVQKIVRYRVEKNRKKSKKKK